MPRTRDQRCKRILNVYFNQQLKDINFDITKLDTRGWKIARYMVKIPSTWVVYKPQYNNETRTLSWVPNTNNQELLTDEKMDEIQQDFKNKFEPYEKKSDTTSLSTSYLRIHDKKTTENENEFHLIVVYDKDYLPFNENIDIKYRNEQLERRNEQLTNQLNMFRKETEQYSKYMRNQYFRIMHQRDEARDSLLQCSILFKERSSKQLESYRKIIRKCYSEMKKEFECPVCYEQIPNNKVFTTPCQHVICSDCTKRCNNVCPMCRQDMTFLPSDNEITVIALNIDV